MSSILFALFTYCGVPHHYVAWDFTVQDPVFGPWVIMNDDLEAGSDMDRMLLINFRRAADEGKAAIIELVKDEDTYICATKSTL